GIAQRGLDEGLDVSGDGFELVNIVHRGSVLGGVAGILKPFLLVESGRGSARMWCGKIVYESSSYELARTLVAADGWLRPAGLRSAGGAGVFFTARRRDRSGGQGARPRDEQRSGPGLQLYFGPHRQGAG